MHDPKLIEAMARAMCKAHGTGQCAALCLSHSSNFTRGGACPEAPRIHDTASALTALCAARPDVAAILRGEAVAVPREATEDMLWAGDRALPPDGVQEWEPDEAGFVLFACRRAEWSAMVAASPYVLEPPSR